MCIIILLIKPRFYQISCSEKVVRVDITGFPSGTRLQNSWEPVFYTSQIRSYMGLTQTHDPLSKNAKILNHSASLVWCYLIHGNKTRKNTVNTEATHQYFLSLLSLYRSVSHPDAVGEK